MTEERAKFTRWDAVWAALVFAAALAVYWPTFSAGFIWNDSDYVTAVQLQPWSGLWKIWFKLGATQQYYPLLHSAFWFEHRLWGDAPLGYHLLNVLLHASSACLFAMLLRRLKVPGAWLAAFLFAVHPVYVESVAWVTEQKNTLSTLLYLLSALTYVGPYGQLSPGRGRRLGAFALFLGAILSKSVAATLPAALLVIIWWRRGRIDWRKEAVRLIPWFVAAIGIGLLTGWVERKFIGAEGSDFVFNPLERVLIAGHVVWFYFAKLFWPAHLVFIYPRWVINAREVRQYLYPLGVVAALAVLWRARVRSRAPLAAALLFIGTLVPTIGFFNVYAFIFSFVADHWQYSAGFGLIALTATGLALAANRLPRRLKAAAPILATPLVLVLALVARAETHGYRDMETFYRTIIRRNPAAWMAHNNYGEILLHAGKVEESKSEFRTALQYRPRYAEAQSNLGLAYMAQGDDKTALTHLNLAVEYQPTLAIYRNNRGIALAGLHRYDEAKSDYAKAVQLQPFFPQAYFNTGLMWEDLKRPDLALQEFRIAQTQDPTSSLTLLRLGIVAAEVGERDLAKSAFDQAIVLSPKSTAPHRELGNLLRQTGHVDQALEQCTEAVNDAPMDAVSRYYLGLVYSDLHRWDDAISQYTEAIRLQQHGYPEAENDLSMAYFHLNEVSAAIATVTKALAGNPKFPEAENNFAVYLTATNKVDEALGHLRKAVVLNPNYYDAWRNLGIVLAAKGRKAEAAKAQARAEALRPGAAATKH